MKILYLNRFQLKSSDLQYDYKGSTNKHLARRYLKEKRYLEGRDSGVIDTVEFTDIKKVVGFLRSHLPV